MSNDNMNKAKAVFDKLCNVFQKRNWHYNKDEEDLVVSFNVSTNDLPMSFLMKIDVGRQLVRLFSPMPYKMDESKRIDGVIATCVASYALADGSFDYDMTDGSITFRMTASFLDSSVSEDLLDYMIAFACAVVDDYNDKFMAISKGYMSIEEFMSKF